MAGLTSASSPDETGAAGRLLRVIVRCASACFSGGGVAHCSMQVHHCVVATQERLSCTTSSFAAAPSSMAPAKRHSPATWRSTATASPRSAASSGPARREIDADGPAGHARLGRRAHALRRPGDVGPAAGAVVLAWRHHGDVRQLRRRLRPGEEASSRRADGPDGRRRGDSQSGAGRRPELGVGDLPRIHGCAGASAARHRHRGAGRAPAAARLRDGRPRGAARSGDAGRHRRDAPPDHRGAARPARSASPPRAPIRTRRRTASWCRRATPTTDELLGIGSALGVDRHRRVRHEQRLRRRGIRAALDAEARQGDRPADLVPADRPLRRPGALAAPDQGRARGARRGPAADRADGRPADRRHDGHRHRAQSVHGAAELQGSSKACRSTSNGGGCATRRCAAKSWPSSRRTPRVAKLAQFRQVVVSRCDKFFVMGDPPDYEPARKRASPRSPQRAGRRPTRWPTTTSSRPTASTSISRW